MPRARVLRRTHLYSYREVICSVKLFYIPILWKPFKIFNFLLLELEVTHIIWILYLPKKLQRKSNVSKLMFTKIVEECYV